MAEEKVTGFDMISAARYQGWTPEIISEFSRIITNFYNDPKIKRIFNFHDELNQHIYHSPRAHMWDISSWSSDLIGDLYTKYRELGFTGTREDMLKKIYDELPIGTKEDILEGYREDLACNVLGWQKYWQEHINNPNTHATLQKIFRTQVAPLSSPSLYFSMLFKDRFSKLKADGYDFVEWKDTEGSIVYDFVYDFSDVHDEVSGKIFEVTSRDFSLDVQFKFDGEITCRIITNVMSDEEVYTRILELPFGPKLHIPSVISYHEDKIVIRDARGQQEFPFIHAAEPAKLFIEQPMVFFGTGIREWMYYPEYFDDSQRLFFVD